MRSVTEKEKTAWRIGTVAYAIAAVIVALMWRYESLYESFREPVLLALNVLVWVPLLNVLRVRWAERRRAQRQAPSSD